MRYAWDQMNTYLNESSYKKMRLTFFLRLILQSLRKWDYISSVRVDKFVANSSFTAKRIKKYWGGESKIIHPPVNTNYFFPNNNNSRATHTPTLLFHIAVKKMFNPILDQKHNNYIWSEHIPEELIKQTTFFDNFNFK